MARLLSKGRSTTTSPSPGSQTSEPAGTPIANLVSDPVASLCLWPIEVRIAGNLIAIPALPAALWVAAIGTENLDAFDMMATLSPGSEEVIFNALKQGDLEIEEFLEICLEILDMAAGRPWWITIKLIGIARDAWSNLGGELAFRGIDAGSISLGAWLDAIYMICMRTIPSEKAILFTSQLEAPPQGFGVEPAEMEMSRSAFLALGK